MFSTNCFSFVNSVKFTHSLAGIVSQSWEPDNPSRSKITQDAEVTNEDMSGVTISSPVQSTKGNSGLPPDSSTFSKLWSLVAIFSFSKSDR